MTTSLSKRVPLANIKYSPTVPSDFLTAPLYLSALNTSKADSQPPTSYSRLSRVSTPPHSLFYLRVTANTMPGKSVVRHWAKRRMRDALTRELKAMGWSIDGRWQGEGEAKKDLIGLLNVFTLKPILMATGAEVENEARVILEKVTSYGDRGRRKGGKNRHAS